jgi:hypothetical protein
MLGEIREILRDIKNENVIANNKSFVSGMFICTCLYIKQNPNSFI